MNIWAKRIEIALVTLLMVIVLPLSASAVDQTTDNGLEYADCAGGIAITGYIGNEEVLTIPAKIDGLPVVEVKLSSLEGHSYIHNTVTQKVVLPESVTRLSGDAFIYFEALTEVEGLEYVQQLGGYCFVGTKVSEMIFSEKLEYAGASAFECETLTTLRIPDDLDFDQDFTSNNMFRYNTALSSIELIETGNTPTLVKDGPALYTADMKTLICYPCGYKGNISYRIPEGVEELATNAFDLRDIYAAEGLQDAVVPASVKKIYENTFYTGIYIMNGGNSEHFVMPHLHVYEDSPIASYCENMGYTYFIRTDDTVTLEERIAQIIGECVAEGMSDYEKAFAINQWLVENTTYDETLTRYTADSILLNGTGVCQSYMLSYEMLLDYVGIDSRQFFVLAGGEGHGFNAVYLNDEWCYVDTTWNNNSRSDCYFGMNVDMIMETYDMSYSFDNIGVGNNDGYINYHPYQRGVYDAFIQVFVEKIKTAVENRQTQVEWTAAELQEDRDIYLTDATGNAYFDAAVLASYLRAQDWGEGVYLSVKYLPDTDSICILISYDDPLPNDYVFSLYNDGICIDMYTGDETSVVIPEEIMGLSVIKIGDNAFDGNRSMTSLTIPDSVTEIGNYAFFLCESLKEVKLSSKINSIGYAAFGDCYLLEDIVLPEGLTSVGSDLFFQCTSLKNVSIPESLFELGKYMFTSCESLETVQLPEGITIIPEGLFSGCDALKAITLPSGVTGIEAHAFTSTGIKELVLPDQLEYIGEYAFLGSALESLEMPASLREIADNAFNSCRITSIILNEGLESIGDNAFHNSNLEGIIIPSSVASIGSSCFADCFELTDIEVVAGNPCYSAVDNILYNADGTILLFSPITTSGIVKIPAGVVRIGNEAFSWNALLTGVVFEGEPEELGKNAFAHCSALKQITIPEGITAIPWGCFWDCSALNEVNLPETLREIEGWAFLECFSLNRIDIPDSVTSIAQDVFPRALMAFKIPASMTSLPDNLLNSTSVGELYVHEDVTYIGLNNLPCYPYKVYGKAGTYAQTYAEQNGYEFIDAVDSPVESIELNIEVASLDIGYSLQLIAALNPENTIHNIVTWASSDETVASVDTAGIVTAHKAGTATITATTHNGLTASCAIMVVGSINSIELNHDALVLAASGIGSIRQLTYTCLPANAETGTLTWVSSSENVVKVDENGKITAVAPGTAEIVLSNDKGISDVCEITVRDDLSVLQLPSALTEIESEAFEGAMHLEIVVIPEGMTSIGERAFAGCEGLVIVHIPDSVSTIGKDAFAGCDKLLIVCSEGSYALRWAKEGGAEYVLK